MTEVSVRILPLALLLACSGGTDSPTPTDESGTPPGTTTGVIPTTGTTSEPGGIGQVVYWWEDRGPTPPKQWILGMFAPHFDGIGAPAPCATLGNLCVNELPAADGDWVDVTEPTFDAIETGVTWVGNDLEVGGFALPFQVNAENGYGFYQLQINGSALDALDVRLEGDWGEWNQPQVVPVAAALVGTEPEIGAYIGVTDSLDLTWTPAVGDAFVYLEAKTNSTHRIWRFADSGSLSIDAADLPEWGNEIADITLYQVQGSQEFDANGNTLIGQGWSSVSFSASGADLQATCGDILASDPSAPSGSYFIQPEPASPPYEVYCDMTIDGGGWTLVASSNAVFQDAGVAYDANLATLQPNSLMDGVWTGMRDTVGNTHDIRFACKTDPAVDEFTVDLSFYAVDWYQTITTGTDNDSCFNESNGAGWGTPPERRNNRSGVTLPLGDQYGAGFMESEDSCSATTDFTVDFDDRGMDGDQSDGTDWGEDDGQQKCGTSGLGSGAWYIFVR